MIREKEARGKRSRVDFPRDDEKQTAPDVVGLPNEVWTAAGLQPIDRGVLLELASLAPGWSNLTTPSIAEIAGHLGVKRRTVERSRDRLVRLGLIVREGQTVYRLTWKTGEKPAAAPPFVSLPLGIWRGLPASAVGMLLSLAKCTTKESPNEILRGVTKLGATIGLGRTRSSETLQCLRTAGLIEFRRDRSKQVGRWIGLGWRTAEGGYVDPRCDTHCAPQYDTERAHNTTQSGRTPHAPTSQSGRCITLNTQLKRNVKPENHGTVSSSTFQIQKTQDQSQPDTAGDLAATSRAHSSPEGQPSEGSKTPPPQVPPAPPSQEVTQAAPTPKELLAMWKGLNAESSAEAIDRAARGLLARIGDQPNWLPRYLSLARDVAAGELSEALVGVACYLSGQETGWKSRGVCFFDLLANRRDELEARVEADRRAQAERREQKRREQAEQERAEAAHRAWRAAPPDIESPLSCLDFAVLEELEFAPRDERYDEVARRGGRWSVLCHRKLVSFPPHDGRSRTVAITITEAGIQALANHRPQIEKDRAAVLRHVAMHDGPVPYFGLPDELDPHYLDDLARRGLLQVQGDNKYDGGYVPTPDGREQHAIDCRLYEQLGWTLPVDSPRPDPKEPAWEQERARQLEKLAEWRRRKDTEILAAILESPDPPRLADLVERFGDAPSSLEADGMIEFEGTDLGQFVRLTDRGRARCPVAVG